MPVKSICSYCAVGCGVLVSVAGGRIIRVEGDPDYPVNQGMLCSKGRNLHKTVHVPGRALYPLMRANRADTLTRVDWDDALGLSADKFAAIIREHGPDAVAFYISGQLLTEDYYVFNKLMKGFIGSNNVDSNSRLCMSSAVAGYKRAFGVDGPPGCYDDVENADNLFIFGANPAFAHPILFRRMEQARENSPDLKVVVADPRRTDSCSIADLHLPVKPGTDVVLMLAMLNVMLWEGLLDEEYITAHTTGFEAVRESAAIWTPRKASAVCGVDAGAIVQAANWFATGNTMSMWTMGFNQSTAGVDKNNALINLHLATGNIGKPGTGPFSLTGQPNAMGGRESGSLANLLPGHRDLANETDCAEVGRLWGGVPIRGQAGKSAVDMFEAIEAGHIKAVWIASTNPVASMPDTALVRRALAKAEWVMVSEAFHPTETSHYADVVFPAAGWGEKEGTMTNAERRIARVRKAVEAPGDARGDWWIVNQFARRLGAALGRSWDDAFAFDTPADVFEEHKALLSGRDCAIDGLSYAAFETVGSAQWPVTKPGVTKSRLYEDGVFATPDGKARFVAVSFRPPARATDAAWPLALTTGRYRDQWHTMTKTGRVAALHLHAPRAELEIHPADAARRGLADGELAEVRSQLGAALFPVRITKDIREGVVFLPMHFGSQFKHGGDVNALYFGDTDPISRQPELKHVPVEVVRAPVALWGCVTIEGDHLTALRHAANAFSYGAVSFGGQKLVTRLEVALLSYSLGPPSGGQQGESVSVSLGPPSGGRQGESAHEVTLGGRQRESTPESILDATISSLVGFADTLVVSDGVNGEHRRVWVKDGRVVALRWLGPSAEGLKSVESLGDTMSSLSDVRPWLRGGAPTVAAAANRGPIVCSCMNVSAGEIARCIGEGAQTVAAVKAACGAGTGCGSCVPQVKRMLTNQ